MTPPCSIKQDEFGKDACIIGNVMLKDANPQNAGKVYIETLIGDTRIVDMLTGEQLSKIC